jgi:sulfur carrier protein
MKITVNGKERKFKKNLTINEILKELEIVEMVMACAVNTQIVKKDEWNSFKPKSGDKLEFLEFVGGG